MSFFNKIKEYFSEKQLPANILQIPLPVKGNLFVSPMPFGPYDTKRDLMKLYSKKKIKAALVLVTNQEIKKKARKDIFREYKKLSINVLHLPIPDLTAPILDQVSEIMPSLTDCLATDNLVVHCNAGVGRTGVLVACLVKQVLKYTGDEAIEYIQNHMMTDLTDEQKRFVIQWERNK